MRAQAQSASGLEASARPYLAVLLIVAFVMPFFFYLGPLRLSVYRIVMIVFLVPTLVWWASGQAGRQRPTDYLVIAFTLWAALAIAWNEGISQTYEYIGITSIETLAAYFIARTAIRDARSFRIFVRCFFWTTAVLLPFTLYQNVTERPVLLEFFGRFAHTYELVYDEPRLGLYRAQASMPHPILFGVYCSPVFALTWYVLGYKRNSFAKATRAGWVTAVVFTSLSTGAFLSVVIQIALGLWRWIFDFYQARWKLLGTIFLVLYVLIELVSARSAVQIFARYLTLNSASAWTRMYTFEYASDDVLARPIFGIGFDDWTRPNWLVASVDNFWLVLAMRYGIPAFLMVLLAVIVLFRQVGANRLTGELASYRLGFIFALGGVCVSAITVHLWEASYCMLFFLMGSGVWLIDAKDRGGGEAEDPAPAGRDLTIRYTRFG